MGLMDYLTYQKNKVIAGGNTEKEMELNRQSMEARDKAIMEKRVKEEQARRVQLARDQAKQEYDVKYAQEEQRIKYERKVAQAKAGGSGGFLSGLFTRRQTASQPNRVRTHKEPSILDKFTSDKPNKLLYGSSKKKGKVNLYKI